MISAQEKFQDLLRELFQFDCADLDFGIYRIMNHKRDVIERFIAADLPQAIAGELGRDALAEQSQAAAKLAEAAAKVKTNFGPEALDPDGNLAASLHTFPLGKEYLALQASAAGSRARDALEVAIYNHLYAFFSRYYQEGDFISKRRYSKRERYAIPYNGEEVYLYWANHDQYYVKTGEYFTDYAFVSRGVTVHFKLRSADVEQNNVKGDKRFFLPYLDEIAWDEAARQLVIPFEYRPLNGQEEITYGGKNQQDAIIAQALTSIPKRLSPKTAAPALAALQAERSESAEGRAIRALEHHLRQYTRRNTSDFFIHKDLAGFLSRELDFYLKNEVLNLDELEAAGEGRAEGWFQTLRVIKGVGASIIAFLAQIEDFQKMLWEKRKFVTETRYCITLASIPEAFYAEIAAGEGQWEEWRALFHIDEEQADLFGEGAQGRRVAFLGAHPTLVVDTQHFAADFVDRLLGSFPDLDEMTDGVLVHSENWQALAMLLERYRSEAACIHIDPPYNTQVSGFLYKNDYQHSSWLSMMNDRIDKAFQYLSPDGVLMCHIDENEYDRLRGLLAHGTGGHVATAVWDKLNPMMGAKGLAIQHEYVLLGTREAQPFSIKPENVKLMLSMARSLVRQHGGATQEARTAFTEWVRGLPGLSGGERAYQYLDPDGHVYRLAAMGWPNPNPPPPSFFKPLIHPITGKPCPVPSRGWSQSPESMARLISEDLVVFGPDETTQPQKKVRLSSDKALSSILRDGSRGKTDIEQLGLDFTYSHPVTLYKTLLDAGTPTGEASLIVDFFAGSGTTGHAVIALNRRDEGQRKFILVEMADYFDTVLLPRIKKVTYSPEWKEGKPQRLATAEEAERSPRIVKVLRLESYEDALNNIAFDVPGQQALQLEDYLLQYMLRWETRGSETLLNVGQLASPFSYQLHLHADGETRAQPVDLPETFNYLLGLHVQTRRALDDGGRRYLVYRGRIDHRQVAVIWRETEGWQQVDYERDRDYVAAHGLAEGADEILVNGDSLIPGARALEPVFKARMFAPAGA